ncbi:MAG: phosphoenolpyruvate synthase [Chloroflexi bacterium]|nr:phosphoenolpyruvate synthase [Chloroflexota bacterium]
MTSLVRPLSAIRASDLQTVGGKAANLGELVHAEFPVPDGFVLTTEAYLQAAHVAGVDPTDPVGAAERLRNAVVPEAVARDAKRAYAELGGGRVAVRSSATAEDLPGASFAGQQDTYLNVVGDEDLLDAIRRCWASLWNDRAVAYRAKNAIDPAGVSLAVVVQKMVEATAAGVLFTADPLTGQRGRAVVDAVPELGERLVSGTVNPDHFVVDPVHHQVLERRLAGTAAVLSEAELSALADIGGKVEAHFATPQDIEFALDAERRIWLVQSRPITTLYPLPERLPDPARDLRVYFSGNVFQGYFEPLTPMGIQFFQLLGTGVYRTFGARIRDPVAGPPGLVEAGMRLFIDVTPVVRDRVGQGAFASILGAGEARSSVVLRQLASDPRLRVTRRSQLASLRVVAAGLLRAGVPQAALPVLARPLATRARYEREIEAITRIALPPHADADARLDAFERLLVEAVPAMLPRLLGLMAPAMLSLGLAHALLRGVARPDELQTLTRGAPNNPTTEMDLALWAMAARLRSDVDARRALLEQQPADLARAYAVRSLPSALQRELAAFLARYGFRSIGEIDVGVKRWSEDPTHILGVLSNYIRLDDPALAPDAQFARGRAAAGGMLSELVGRVHGPRRWLVQLVLRRMRTLIGFREAPKYHIIRLLATPARQLLLAVGGDLAGAGLLAQPEDIFFLRLPEARRAARGEDFRAEVASRRERFERERARRHIPRVLLSDGTDAEVALVAPTTGDGLSGSPASPGVVEGIARVILSPLGARLEPGEILVAPSTDPGWTPLFLTAGGLVMEMGGMMSHGAVVAREYGIPAVVGVAGATERIASGQRVTVDGSAGTVAISVT